MVRKRGVAQAADSPILSVYYTFKHGMFESAVSANFVTNAPTFFPLSERFSLHSNLNSDLPNDV